MTQILTVAIELIFAVLFVLSVVRYRRERNAVSRDLVLIFGSFAWLLVQEIVKTIGGTLPAPVTQIATLYLLAQPIFALHLAGEFATLKRFAMPLAVAGFLATGGPLVVLGTGAPKVLGLVAVAVFMGIDLAAAIIIGLSARGRRGPAAVRRQIVACSTAIMGFALLVAGIASSAGGPGGATLVAPSLVLVSGLGYLVALLPPKRLQRIWHASAAFPELRDFLALADDSQIWNRLVMGARRMTGAPIALAVEPTGDGWRVLASSGIDPAATPRIFSHLRADQSEQAASWDDGAAAGAFAYGMTVPLAGGSEDTGPAAGTPRLVVVSDRPPLFPDDDRLLIEALGSQALTLAQRATLAREQRRLTGELRESMAARDAAEGQLDRFFELSDDLFCLAGFDGRFHRVNEAWSRTLGWSVEDLTSTPFMDFVHPDDRETTLAAFGDLLEGGSVVAFENRYRTKTGEYVWLQWNVRSAPAEQLVRAVARDVTGAKLEEATAKRMADEVSAAHEAARSAAEEASHAKSAFLASMSHELRTPLNAIIGFADLMRDQLDDDGTLRVAPEWVEHIHNGGQHLLEIINDILDLSKVEAGRFELDRSTFDIGAAITESVASMRPLADKKGQTMELTVPTDLAIAADHGRFRQILYNLVSNAVKYTPDGGSIRVEVAELPDAVEIAVIDDGIGMDTDNVERVFEEFWQAGESGYTNGTGLGLAVTRRLVEAHGGSIRVESARGTGSRFTVSLPHAATMTQAEPAVRSADTTERRRTETLGRAGDVLIVEDDPSTVRLLRAYLEPHGFAIRVATSGPEALQMAKEHRPGAILLDVILPGIDGWEVMRQLKADPELADVPVIFESAVDERTVGMALGAVDYILKPIDRRVLLRSIGRILAGRRVASRPARILTIDDEVAALDMIGATVASAGHETIRASGGADGIDLANQHLPDLIVCDLLMPDVDGFDVVDALRADPRTASIPILIVTNYELTAAERKGLAHKVSGIIAKSSGPHDLRRVLDELLAQAAA